MARAIEVIVNDVLKGVSTQVFPYIAPQNTAEPFVVFTVITDIENELLDGDVGLIDALVQVDVYASKLSACKTLAKSCRKALRASKEIVCHTESSANNYESDTKFFRNSSDYKIFVESEV